MATIVDDLLQSCWPDGLPRRLDELVDRNLAEQLLNAFKLEPVFPLEGTSRPVRLTVSAEGERNRWREKVAELWPSRQLAGLWQQGPAPIRWMIDSDGSDQATLFLDDLHNSDLDLAGPHGLPVMCLTLELPAGERGQLTRHEKPPLPWLTGCMEASLGRLIDAGAVGVFALRWQGDGVASVAWISESRWRRNPASARRAVRALGAHPAYDAALDVLAKHGRIGYPDVVELFDDGRVDLTLGVL